MSISFRGLRARAAALLLALALVLAALATGVAQDESASAQTNPYQRGPNPTTASIEATTGPFAIAQTTVGSGYGFGAGTIYYPADADGVGTREPREVCRGRRLVSEPALCGRGAHR